MFLNIYCKFYKAINQRNSKQAESIFAYSDIRDSLISQSLQNCERGSILHTIESFSSIGLRTQALIIWDKCNQ